MYKYILRVAGTVVTQKADSPEEAKTIVYRKLGLVATEIALA